jgi:hypothetical protein
MRMSVALAAALLFSSAAFAGDTARFVKERDTVYQVVDGRKTFIVTIENDHQVLYRLDGRTKFGTPMPCKQHVDGTRTFRDRCTEVRRALAAKPVRSK